MGDVKAFRRELLARGVELTGREPLKFLQALEARSLRVRTRAVDLLILHHCPGLSVRDTARTVFDGINGMERQFGHKAEQLTVTVTYWFDRPLCRASGLGEFCYRNGVPCILIRPEAKTLAATVRHELAHWRFPYRAHDYFQEGIAYCLESCNGFHADLLATCKAWPYLRPSPMILAGRTRASREIDYRHRAGAWAIAYYLMALERYSPSTLMDYRVADLPSVDHAAREIIWNRCLTAQRILWPLL